MPKWIVVAGMAALGLSSCNSQNALTENTPYAEKPNLTMQDVIPVRQTLSTAEKQRQEEFLARQNDRFKSRKSASSYYVAEAQRNFNEGKIDSAKHLLGNAWLMDSTNNDIFWGYGLVYGQQKQYDKALFVLYHGLEHDKENPRLLTDIATSHLGRFYEESSLEDLHQSKKLLEEAARLDPENAAVYYKLAINSYYLSEYAKAWEYLHASIRKDKEVADGNFISALLEKQHDPQGVFDKQNIQ